MSSSPPLEERGEPTLRVVVLALAVTLGVQTLSAFALQSPTVFGPIATRDLGIAPERLGTFVVIINLAAMLMGLASPSVIQRFGPLRTVQIVIGLLIAGLLLGGTGWLPAVILAAVLFGIGNGFIGPVSSTILVERSPRSAMSLVFSIKQTGVPVGSMLAGAIIPIAVLAIGWRHTLWVCAALYVLALVAMQPLRADYDRHRDVKARLTVRAALTQMRAAIAMTLDDPRLLNLGFITFAYVAQQIAVMTYAVTYFNLELGHALVAAGFLYAAMQFAGIVGRIFWGFLADRMERPGVLLGALGVVSAAFSVVLALVTPQWSTAAVVTVCVLFGLTGVGWNGLFFAEVARTVPRDKVTRATSGGMFFSFLGGLSGPLAFSTLLPSGTSYGWGFAVIGVLPLAAGLRLILASSPRGKQS